MYSATHAAVNQPPNHQTDALERYQSLPLQQGPTLNPISKITPLPSQQTVSETCRTTKTQTPSLAQKERPQIILDQLWRHETCHDAGLDLENSLRGAIQTAEVLICEGAKDEEF